MHTMDGTQGGRRPAGVWKEGGHAGSMYTSNFKLAF